MTTRFPRRELACHQCRNVRGVMHRSSFPGRQHGAITPPWEGIRRHHPPSIPTPHLFSIHGSEQHPQRVSNRALVRDLSSDATPATDQVCDTRCDLWRRLYRDASGHVLQRLYHHLHHHWFFHRQVLMRLAGRQDPSRWERSFKTRPGQRRRRGYGLLWIVPRHSGLTMLPA